MAQRFRGGEQGGNPEAGSGVWRSKEQRQPQQDAHAETDPTAPDDEPRLSRLTRRYGGQEVGLEEAGHFGRYQGRGESGAGLGYGREYAAGDLPRGAEDTTGRAYGPYEKMGGSTWQGGGTDYEANRRALVDRDRPAWPYGPDNPHAPPRAMDYRGRGPKGYRRSDERLMEVICEGLTEAPDIDASEVAVQCKDGIVTLDGSVVDRQMKHRIEDIVDDCYGVEDIENRLRVTGGRKG